MLRVHLAQFFIRSVGFGIEGLPSPLKVIKALFARTHGFHAVPDVMFVRRILRQGGRVVRQDFRGSDKGILGNEAQAHGTSRRL